MFQGCFQGCFQVNMAVLGFVRSVIESKESVGILIGFLVEIYKIGSYTNYLPKDDGFTSPEEIKHFENIARKGFSQFEAQ